MPIYRPSTVLDLDMVLACLVTEPISWVTPDRYQQELASGSYRPEWTWLAQDKGELVGRAVWWAPAGREFPVALDCLWVADDVADRTAVATALLAAGHAVLQDGGAEKPPDYEVDLDPRWRDRSDIAAAFAWRQEAARRAGLTHTLERLSFAWTPEDGIPDQSHRLRFTTESADEVFLQAFARVAEGSLDDLLTEITRQHADHGAPRITGTADTTNAPMVAAFTRGGYTCTGVRMVLSATA